MVYVTMATQCDYVTKNVIADRRIAFLIHDYSHLPDVNGDMAEVMIGLCSGIAGETGWISPGVTGVAGKTGLTGFIGVIPAAGDI